MKKYVISIAVLLFIVIDLCVLLYPTAGKYFNSMSQSRAVAGYYDDVTAIDDTETRLLLESAREYNKALQNNAARFDFTEENTAEYNKQLKTKRGVMSILIIDKINVKLALYHGTSQSVLQIGLGHMQGTSLPVGGKGTHSFISGHRGVPSSALLTELDKMEEGDSFTLYTFGETLTYQVDSIQVVEPHEVRALSIDPEMDYCTLVTCTPYGINSHRLLVRGRRVENASGSGGYVELAGAKQLDRMLQILIFLLPLTVLFIVVFIIQLIFSKKRSVS